MLLPTQDKELDIKLRDILGTMRNEIENRDPDFHYDAVIEAYTSILKLFETHGYYKGLPTFIEEALNSGDGVYRP